jgi:hypothetical protein
MIRRSNNKGTATAKVYLSGYLEELPNPRGAEPEKQEGASLWCSYG